MGIKPPGSGRKKGTKNKSTLFFEDQVQKAGLDPVHRLCLIANGDCKALDLPPGAISAKLMCTATMAILEYIYPKRRAIDVDARVIDVTQDRPLQHLSDQELEKL